MDQTNSWYMLKNHNLFDNWLPIKLYKHLRDAKFYFDSKSLYEADDFLRTDNTNRFKKIGDFNLLQNFNLISRVEEGYLINTNNIRNMQWLTSGYNIDIRKGATFFIEFGINQAVNQQWARPIWIGKEIDLRGDFGSSNIRVESSNMTSPILLAFSNFGNPLATRGNLQINTTWQEMANNASRLSLMFVLKPSASNILTCSVYVNNKFLGEQDFAIANISTPLFNYFGTWGNRYWDNLPINMGCIGGYSKALSDQERDSLYKELRKVRPVKL